MKNGTYLIVRRVQMHLETWDRTSLKEQENTFGRHRDSGAPLGAVDEFDPVDLELKDDKGNLVIPEDCHVRLAKEVLIRVRGNLMRVCSLFPSKRIPNNLLRFRRI